MNQVQVTRIVLCSCYKACILPQD